MNNEDEECFKWCVTRALNPVAQNAERVTKVLREQAKKLDWDGLKFPLNVKDIHRFEILNPGLAVNVYIYEGGLKPLRVSNVESNKSRIHLLLICAGEKKHYCLIKNLSRLVSREVSNHKNKKFICERCLNYFTTQKVLHTHSELCRDHEAVREKLPKDQTFLSFRNHHKKMDMPFVIYADFESIIKPLHTVQPNPKKCYTEKKQKHIPVSFCYFVKCSFDDRHSKLVEYTATSEDEDVAQIFVDMLEEEVKAIYKNHPPKEMVFTNNDVMIFENAKCCWLCGEAFTEKDDEWLDSIDKLDETELPPIEAFFSILSGSGISEEEYSHAQRVWKTFRMKTMRDYHNLYNRSDVMVLCDVFENFRKVCKENYDLDPCWYYTAPGLAWDACLKMTEIKLELLSDPNMLHMFEKGIRGGVSMIPTRYSKANNKYMGEKFDPFEPSKFITYLDANNLYGWAMSKSLPTHGFKWVDEKDFDGWKNFPCILEVDLGVKKELHDYFNDYPLAPENLSVGKVKKLLCTLYGKKKYIIHHETLKLYMSLGMEIGKIHRIIRFEEREWMKKYIDLNTELRTKADNDFEKDFFKLMNN